MMNSLIAYCGVDCSTCTDYRNEKCPGCRQTDWSDTDVCLPVKCCRERKISICGECPAFPCGEMSDFYTESESHALAFERMKAAERPF